jgi:hypothetical protein
MLRTLAIDLDGICHTGCSEWGSSVFLPDDDVLDFTTLPTTIWKRDIVIKISVIQLQGKMFHENLQNHDPGLGVAPFVCDAGRITKTLHSFLESQLGLRKYTHLLCDLSIRRDGSSGVIKWATTKKSCFCPTECECESYHDEFYKSRGGFTVHHDGTRLEIGDRKKLWKLLELLMDVQSSIFSLAIREDVPIRLDLNRQREFTRGALHVNRNTVQLHWSEFLDNTFILELSAAARSTTMSDFGPLRRILRKTFKTHWSLLTQDGSWLLEDSPTTQIVLKFRIDGVTQSSRRSYQRTSPCHGDLDCSR